MVSTITVFDGTDTDAATTAVEALAPATTDVIVTYTLGNQVFVIKRTP